MGAGTREADRLAKKFDKIVDLKLECERLKEVCKIAKKYIILLDASADGYYRAWETEEALAWDLVSGSIDIGEEV